MPDVSSLARSVTNMICGLTDRLCALNSRNVLQPSLHLVYSIAVKCTQINKFSHNYTWEAQKYRRMQ